jgi:hypothetical protein
MEEAARVIWPQAMMSRSSIIVSLAKWKASEVLERQKPKK